MGDSESFDQADFDVPTNIPCRSSSEKIPASTIKIMWAAVQNSNFKSVKEITFSKFDSWRRFCCWQEPDNYFRRSGSQSVSTAWRCTIIGCGFSYHEQSNFPADLPSRRCALPEARHDDEFGNTNPVRPCAQIWFWREEFLPFLFASGFDSKPLKTLDMCDIHASEIYVSGFLNVTIVLNGILWDSVSLTNGPDFRNISDCRTTLFPAQHILIWCWRQTLCCCWCRCKAEQQHFRMQTESAEAVLQDVQSLRQAFALNKVGVELDIHTEQFFISVQGQWCWLQVQYLRFHSYHSRNDLYITFAWPSD